MARNLALALAQDRKLKNIKRYSAYAYQIEAHSAVTNSYSTVRERFVFDHGWTSSASRIALIVHRPAIRKFVLISAALVLVLSALSVYRVAPGSIFEMRSAKSSAQASVRNTAQKSCIEDLKRFQNMKLGDLAATIRGHASTLVVTDKYDFGGVQNLIVEVSCGESLATYQLSGASQVKAMWTRLN